MSLPIVLGAKSVSSRPLVMKDVDDLEEEEHEYFAEDEVTPLDPVLLPGAPLTAMTVCPKQEWLALMNIQYYDMMMVVDDDNENQEEESSSPQQQRRRRLARHSTIAEVRIQISPLSLPFSSKYREVLHRLELPHLPSVTSPTSKKHQHHHHRHNDRHKQKQSYLDDEHLEHSGKHAPVQPSLVFSSDRRNLACLIPFPRGSHSVVVSFTLQRPTPHSAPRPRPAIPAYIPTSTNTTTRSNFLVPETSGEPQWLTFPTHAALDIRQHALYWLHNITSLCDTSAISGKQRSGTRGSSVLLAGCRDGSILGISFNPLLLAGVLYHPAQGKGDGAVTFLSHITTNAAQASTDSTSEMMYNRGGVLGRLVAVRESGKAQIFQTRMVLSSLNDDDDDTEDHSGSFSALNDMDTTDYSATSDHPASSGAAGVVMIHGESFHVVKTGRRNSLPANARLALDEHDQHNLHASWRPKQQDDDYDNAPVGTTGLLMFLEPLSELSGCVSRAQWITGVLLVVLDKPTMSGGYRQSKKSDDAKNRVAQVLGVFPDRRSPETLSELLLTHEDLREHAHTTFSLEEEEEVSLHSENADSSGNPSMARNPLLDQNLFHFLEASHGIHADPLSGCLAISSVRISSKSAMKTKNEEEKKANDDSPEPKGAEAKAFVCIWQWRPNVIGFTAVSSKVVSSYHYHHRPISRLMFTIDKLSNARRLAHVHSPGGDGGFDRVRKDIFEIGLLSPPQDNQRDNGWGTREVAPLLLTSSTVSFASVMDASSDASEIEWQESALPINYRLEYGAPSIAAMGSRGRSIAVASSRGLCILECSPMKWKKLDKERAYLLPEYVREPGDEKKTGSIPSRKGGAVFNLPPKWHLFGNEMEEKSFRVIAMAWWEGIESTIDDHHLCDDLLIAIIQLHYKEDQGSTSGAYYLACWSQRSLDAAHQRLKPLDDDLNPLSRQWGVRLPTDFKVKSLKLVAQPTRVDISEPEVRRRRKLRERKAVVLLTSEQGQNGTVDFVVYQLQTTPSIKTQSSDSYKEQNPYSILSRCCSIGQLPEGPPNSSISGLFLASASFQFDLVRQKSNADNRSNGGGHQTSEIVGTVGVFRSPGFGLDAIVVTSAGLSKVISVFNYNEHGNAMLILQKSMKSLEVSSYWLSDVVNATRPISTSYGENGLIDLFVWTIQLTDGKLLCWFVPCLEFHSTPSQNGSNESECPNVFSSRVMFGSICPIGNSDVWLQQTSTKTGRDFIVGCIPRSPHGCFLSTGQASRKFHRSIAGDFDHTLFAPDFLEHEFLHLSDLLLSPPAFMASVAALIRTGVYLALEKKSDGTKTQQESDLVNAGGNDMENAILAIDTCDHIKRLSRIHQDAAFMALRLLVLRSVEQLADDFSKKNKRSANSATLSASILSVVLHVVQSCTTSRLQFASLLLEVGRQLEPSCFPYLFPLPKSENIGNAKAEASPMTMARCKEKIELRDVFDFFNACVEDGSLLSSVSSLPIIRKKNMSLRNSMLILDHCLRVVVENTKSEEELFFDFSSSERSALSDVFRFGVKLEDSGINGRDNEDYNKSMDGSSDSSDSEDENGGNGARRKGYSLTCGIFSLFSRQVDPASKRLSQGKKGNYGSSRDSQQSFDDSAFDSFAGGVGSVMVELVFPDKSAKFTRMHSWKRAAIISYLLLGQNKSLLPRLSAKQCSSLARSIGTIGFEGGQSGSEPVVDRIATLLTRAIVACRDEINAMQAEKVLDLVLVLLSRYRVSPDLDPTIPGLLIMGIAAAHACNKVGVILDIEDLSVSFTRSYLTAKQKALNMGSC